MALGLAVLSLFGLAVLTMVAAEVRAALFPALPLFGVAYLVVVLHLTGLFLPVRLGAFIAAAGALVLLAVFIWRKRSVRLVPRASALAWLVTVAVGSVGAMLAVVPSLIARSPLAIEPTVKNDAAYYVGVSKWLLSNPITHLPNIGTAPGPDTVSPAFGPALESLRLGLRVGQELTQAALSALTGLDPIAAFSPWLGLWVLLIPGGAWVLGTAFGLRVWGRLVLGAVLVTSFSLINQVLNQNADSLLGIALVGLVVALVASSVRSRSQTVFRAPVWLAALLLASLVGTYTEYIPFAGATLAFVVLVGPLGELKSALVKGVQIVGLSLVLGPFIWFRAVQNTLLVGSIAAGGAGSPSSFFDSVGHLLGPLQGLLFPAAGSVVVGLPSRLILMFTIICVGVGVVAALISRVSRAYALGAMFSAAVVVYIATRGADYVTGRASDIVMPLILTAAVLGWFALARWAHVPGRSTLRGLTIVAVAVMVIATTGLGVRVSLLNTVNESGDDRVVTADYLQAASWVQKLSNDAGVTVATGDLFQQLWLSEALSDHSRVGYVNLRGDLGYRANLSLLSYWNTAATRYVLVGRGAFAAYDADAVVDQNRQFTLLDMTKNATVAVPVVTAASSPSWLYLTDETGAITSVSAGSIQILSERHDLSGISLNIRGLSAGDAVTLSQGGTSLEAQNAVNGRASLRLDAVALSQSLAEVSVAPSVEPGGFTLESLTAR
ncbi:hypothetical protein D4765_07260 [Subtercola vilae]|uniref:Glycosyltransferase RgtA/B/C/D-like domain-containing protein n=1 Tax=Subtercola vilae TaxID=2056433 RepID=A0A4T2C0M6_9MICO|nr:hypothetical protein D4765_07260 [Subtercola vilae]